MSNRRIALLIFLICTGLYALTAAGRLRQPSSDTHFIWMAESWLHKRLDLGRSPPHSNDWAEVEYLRLRDGTTVAGAFQRAIPTRFRTLDGPIRTIEDADIAERTRRYYVSFPPLPAVLLLPLVLAFGHRTNDVIFNVLLAGAIPALFFLLLRRLPELTEPDTEPAPLQRDLWFTGLLAFGTVLYFASVLGQVWYTAHLVSLVLALLFLHCAIGAERPFLAGLLVGGLLLTRPQMVFFGLFLLFEALRKVRGPRSDREARSAAVIDIRATLRPLLISAVPFAILAAAGFWYNYVRFHSLFEFGHSYLTTMQADNIQRYGLFNYNYLPRNLAAAFTLLPKVTRQSPYLQISYHGLSMLLTTPALLYLLWPEPPAGDRERWLRASLWLCALPIAAFSFLYQNTGYIQFGFRFSLDYLVLLLLLLALGSAQRSRGWRFRALVLAGVAVNLFGAITFGRMWQFYFNGLFPAS